MYFYLVRDNSGWMSDLVFKSIDQAITSESWRVDDPDFDVSNDFPLTILRIDTELGLLGVAKVVSEAQMIARFQKKDSQKKGGSK